MIFIQDYGKISDINQKNSQGKKKLVIMLDNSPIHCKKADNALNVKAMNVNGGGKQPLMRDGFFFRGNRRVRR